MSKIIIHSLVCLLLGSVKVFDGTERIKEDSHNHGMTGLIPMLLLVALVMYRFRGS